jgi:hypothetical protein
MTKQERDWREGWNDPRPPDFRQEFDEKIIPARFVCPTRTGGEEPVLPYATTAREPLISLLARSAQEQNKTWRGRMIRATSNVDRRGTATPRRSSKTNRVGGKKKNLASSTRTTGAPFAVAKQELSNY